MTDGNAPRHQARDLQRAETDELIAGQYADRPQLRPVLDAVLATVAGFGEVSVQARKTCVSLVSPRRTFAAVQPTTKSRVDLGLRLDTTDPGGRLLVAKNVASGSINLRIGLTRPEDIDDDVRAWLRRAYDESIAPPARPRVPRRTPAPVVGTLTVVIEGYDLPGLSCHPDGAGWVPRNVHVGLTGQGTGLTGLPLHDRPGLATGPVAGDAPSARWEAEVKVRSGPDGYDFGGTFVRGDRTDRHLGLTWGDLRDDGVLRVFRGAKIRLVDVDPGLIGQALRDGHRLVARVRLTDPNGNPVCARVRPPAIAWHTEPG